MSWTTRYILALLPAFVTLGDWQFYVETYHYLGCAACGFKAGRDEAAALVILYWSMGILPPIKKRQERSNSALESRNHAQVLQLGCV